MFSSLVLCILLLLFFFFFFNDTATTEIYTLSLHDALPIDGAPDHGGHAAAVQRRRDARARGNRRSEEHTSELQSLTNLVCRLLLEKKKQRRSGTGGEPDSSSATTSPALTVCLPPFFFF